MEGGVKEAYNIRADKWEIATEATNKIEQERITRTENMYKELDEQNKKLNDPNDGEVSADGTK